MPKSARRLVGVSSREYDPDVGAHSSVVGKREFDIMATACWRARLENTWSEP